MAKYRIRIESLSSYTKQPWYHLEKKTWYGWTYVASDNDIDFLEMYIEAMNQEPRYYDKRA